MKRDPLPRGVFPKGRWYYLVTAQGNKRIWHKLSLIKDGLPALYAALAQARSQAAGILTMPALIARWELEVMPAHDQKTQKDERSRGKAIAAAFEDFTPAQVETPDCAEFLAQFKSKPCTFNAYRAQLREYMRFAEELGLRPAGTNPLQAIRTKATPARSRYITDSELRRIKVAAMRGDDGRPTRSGAMICALIDMAYLTGQRIGDLLALEWSAIQRDGIVFQPSKVRGSTAARVLIEWTPKLRDVERRLRELRKARRGFAPQVFTTQDGKAYTYWGASAAWQRARRRAGITDCTFHDLRAKALTDKEAREGMSAAKTMGAHATEAQTADYVRHKSARKTKATR